MNKNIRKTKKDFEVIQDDFSATDFKDDYYLKHKESSEQILKWTLIGFGVLILISAIYFAFI